MHYFGVENLKGFRSLNKVELRPITVFVGENSSGKSSFLRCIPLLKQSMEARTFGTILWSGKYVDFGSFSESLNHEAQESTSQSNKEISFLMNFSIPSTSSYRIDKSSRELIEVELKISVSEEEYDNRSYSRFDINIHNNHISFKSKSDLKLEELSINQENFSKEISENHVIQKGFSILPHLRKIFRFEREQKDPTLFLLMNELKKYVHKRTVDKTIESIANSLKFGNDQQIIKQLRNSNLMGLHFAQQAQKWTTNSHEFITIKNLIIANMVSEILEPIAEYTALFFSASKYITPLRAAADRYYRIQNISIDQLDSNGNNLAMFLNAMKNGEREELNEWLKNEMGFQIAIEGSRGHASVYIIDNHNIKTNIADTGFGFSQIIPILVQIWHISKKKTNRLRFFVPSAIVIEQPELHLHPKMQSKVGEAFCKAIKIAKERGINLRIIIETHSEQIVNAIGKCIDHEIISHNDTIVYLVEKKGSAKIRESVYDKGGYLENWPYGFFDGV